MIVTVLGTGSRGNAIALGAGGAALLVDAGFGVRELERRARRAGVDLSALQGIVLTHEHGDHARGVRGAARRRDCIVYGSRGTLRALRGRLDGIRTRALESGAVRRIGPFTVEVCRTPHDGAEPLCVTVREEGSGVRVGVAYDLGWPTPALVRFLRRCTCLIVEANHDEDLLRVGPYPASVRARIGGAAGHLSNRATAGLLARLCHGELRAVVLAHLSDQCNHPTMALQAAKHALKRRGFRGRLLVAGQEEPVIVFDGGRERQLTLGLGE